MARSSKTPGIRLYDASELSLLAVRAFIRLALNLLLRQLPSLRGVFHPSLGLNQWMGFARNWRLSSARQAALVENAIRVGVPAAAAGAGYGGYELGTAIWGP